VNCCLLVHFSVSASAKRTRQDEVSLFLRLSGVSYSKCTFKSDHGFIVAIEIDAVI
jgi:hypothetical protein